MAAITIRNLGDDVKTALRMRAARHGLSMEEEARRILRDGLLPSGASAGEGGLGTLIHQRFAALGGADLDLPARVDSPRPARFER
ncbi:MAG: hypothetical protein LBC97_02160 [Bifidobacteriaceae bacterium]|jgi:plasmid stability protein|nr:hypothetical protein [Bifidobacteriaceae bacterium]